MSEGAKSNWIELMTAFNAEMLPLPFPIRTIDDKPFVLTDATALKGFMAVVMGYQMAPGSPLVTGRALRQRVEEATTIEEVEAIVDDRE